MDKKKEKDVTPENFAAFEEAEAHGKKEGLKPDDKCGQFWTDTDRIHNSPACQTMYKRLGLHLLDATDPDDLKLIRRYLPCFTSKEEFDRKYLIDYVAIRMQPNGKPRIIFIQERWRGESYKGCYGDITFRYSRDYHDKDNPQRYSEFFKLPFVLKMLQENCKISWRFCEVYGFYNKDNSIDTFAVMDLKEFYEGYERHEFVLDRDIRTASVIKGELHLPLTTNHLSKEGLNATFIGIHAGLSLDHVNASYPCWFMVAGKWRDLDEKRHAENILHIGRCI